MIISQRLCLALVFAMGLVAPLAHAERFEFNYSGFVRVVAGYLDSETLHYDGYGDDISFAEHSLIGLQGELVFNEKLSVTAQLLAHSSASRETGVEWFYLSYKPTDSLRFKLGKLRTPLFELSDAIDVGFAYPYILPPKQVYAAEVLGAIEGVNAAYSFAGEKWRGSLDLFAGREEGDRGAPANGSSTGDSAPTTIRDAYGVVGKLGIGNLDFRAAYFAANIKIGNSLLETFQTVLESQGFPLSADSINTNKPAVFIQSSVQYENLDYFVRFEYIDIESDSIFIPDVDSYYASAGYYFSPFTLYGTFAHANSTKAYPLNEISRGVSGFQDLLADGYQTVFDALGDGETDSYSIGARWDLKKNLALKAEVSFLRGSSSAGRSLDGVVGAEEFQGNTNVFVFEGDANFYALALEWIF